MILGLASRGMAEPASWISFQSRPDIHAPLFNVNINDESLVTPGYIFVAPYRTELPGPYIYTTDGDLVWSGSDGSTTEIFHDLHVCNYRGSDHLCFFQGTQIEGYARGRNMIINNDYQPTTVVQSGHGLTLSDMHELEVLDGERMLFTVYQPRPYDLSAYGIKTPNGWVMDGFFQEVDIKSGAVLFEWGSLDHVPLTETYVSLGINPVVGDGLSNSTAWDYFHINSVDKSSQGDYLVSARHTSCIYKISGKDGSVVWRLGGLNSTFNMASFNFSSQHDARFHEENDTHTVLSLFDNGSDNYRNTSLTSSGMIIAIDHLTNTATLVKRFEAPGQGLRSTSQGNTQLLSTGNTFIGWGSNPSFSEHTADGTPVYFATFNDDDSMNYRAFKYNWTATPSDPPALAAQAPSSNGATTFWVSWNGATDYSHWNFYGTTSASDEFALLATVGKQGFQTTYTSPNFHPLAFAESVAVDGSSMRNSSVTGSFP
ncbi:ASST-domain-containing protein [Penicillium argentinense]|uniref:ASST-domain-containing protein n=1 Tax=Penicillium argentinense TaxID=1131581 RepID=A0A9W9G1J4_9EURO|nr:ASST-domain-containing protein [Penicillium argentinense]KAJ5110380.1 ASST-domain-containing protein [Penicillium argentinense]